MNVIRAYPPNYSKIAAVFDLRRWPRAIFCYGDTIYNPSGNEVPLALIAHETAHSERQDGKPEAWWDRYLADRKFRLEEEIIAHRVEWLRFCADGPNRHDRRGYLAAIAGRLASPFYGSMITVHRAREIIMGEAE